MTVRINHAPQLAGLQICMVNTMEQINCALDQGDQRSFRLWCQRWSSLTARAETLLVKILTSEV